MRAGCWSAVSLWPLFLFLRCRLPEIALSGTTNQIRVIATDSGSPSMSATQSFSVFMTRPAQPHAEVSWSNSQVNLSIDGDAGPDYFIEASTNLLDWIPIFFTNSPSLPFLWSDAETTDFDQRFYRIRLGP